MIAFTFYTNWFIPARFKATTYGPFIFIRPSKRGDRGLLEHEKTHVRQFWRNPLFGLWYLLSKKHRLHYEAEAYAVQSKFYPDRLDVLAEILATKYNLGITTQEARAAIVARMR